jgi:enolase
MNKETKKTTWYLPLTPKLGIFFVNNDDWEKMFNKATHMDLNDKESIDYYNDLIAQCEIQDIKDAIDDQHKNFYLFSSTKDELITIKDKYKK